MDFNREGEEIQRHRDRIKFLQESIGTEESNLEEAVAVLKSSQDAQEILQLVSKAIQQRAHEKLSEVVTRCLSSVFDDPYEFKIEFEMKRGRTEAQLKFVRNGVAYDPMSATGGGMVDVAAFALRVACLMLHRPRLRRIVLLDEPFKFVSEQYRDRVRLMLEGLSKDLKVQIIMVTHVSEIATGKIINL